MATRVNLGPVTAYAIAKANGYTGSIEEWTALLVNAGMAGGYADQAAESAAAAEAALAGFETDTTLAVVGKAADAAATGAAITAEGTRVQNMLTSEYNSSKTYYSGQFCVHNGGLYMCAATTATGTWDATKWLVVNLCEIVTNVRNYVDGGKLVRYIEDDDLIIG